MTIVALTAETYADLDSPDNIAEYYIQNWYENNLGKLNTLLNTEIEFDSLTSEAKPELLDYQAAVYKQAFFCFYYLKLSRTFLGTSAYDASDWLEVKEGDTTIKRRNKTEIAKMYAALNKDCLADLETMANDARMNNALPVSRSSEHCLNRYLRIRDV